MSWHPSSGDPMREVSFRGVHEHLKASLKRVGLTHEQAAEKANIPESFAVNMSRRVNLRLPADWKNFRAYCQALGEDPVTVLRVNGLL